MKYYKVFFILFFFCWGCNHVSEPSSAKVTSIGESKDTAKPIIDKINMAGLGIHDSESSLQNIHLKVIAKDSGMIKYETDKGNALAVTIQNGKIVYLENDWSHKPDGEKPLFSDFTFGKTTLREIRTKFGTNGFVHKNVMGTTTETDIVMLNCFELDSPNNEVIVVVTKARANLQTAQEHVADSLKLDAITIADKDYLDEIWGKDKSYDPSYKKIKL